MAKRNMRAALGATLQAEESSLQDRAAKAETYFASSEPSERLEKSSAASQGKVVRDGFSMPSDDYRLIAEIQSRCLEAGVNVTKSKILRAGLRVLSEMSQEALKDVLSTVEDVKTGRPLVR